MRKVSKTIVESKNACDEKIAIDLNHVEYVKEDKLAISGTVGTTIHFTSGRELFINEKYDEVRDIIETFREGK
jgi:hypothetical protein